MTERAVIGCDPGNCTGIGIGIDSKLVMAYDARPDDLLSLPTELFKHEARSRLGVRFTIEIPDRLERGVRLCDVITLATTAGRWIERATTAGARTTRVVPKAWKGTVPKAVMVERIKGRLTADERAIVDALKLAPSKLHNVYDGIGLFLWTVGRLERKWRNG